MLGISTCWFRDTSLGGEGIVRETLELGIEGVELEYRIPRAIYEEMRPLLKKHLRVLSIHNFFPKPDDRAFKKGSGDLFLLSSPDREERATAVKFTIRSMEHAHDVEAQAVILHLGRVEMTNPMETLRVLHDSGKIQQGEGMELLAEQRDLRQSKSRRSLDAVLFSLEKLNREAERLGVRLGVENRYHFHEIPDFDEIGVILDEFRGGNLGYWHDVGHAAVQESLGIRLQKDLLEAYSKELIGMHFHDAKGLDDHFPPGHGEINYAEIRPFMKPDLINILEVHPKVARDALIEGIRFIMDSLEDLNRREDSVMAESRASKKE
jgi:sugar phosphate isomerase/epimerase